MSKTTIENHLISKGATAIYQAFGIYRSRFKEITRRAPLRFKNRDWHGVQTDAILRLDLYKDAVDHIEIDIRRLLTDHLQEKKVWALIKTAYSDLLIQNDDWELAETFFNSITRRIFATVGVDGEIEFVNTDFDTPPTPTPSKFYGTFKCRESSAGLIRMVLAHYPLMATFQNIEDDAQQVADKIESYLQKMGASGKIDAIDMAHSVFYRGMGAYLIGRIYSGSVLVPLAIALLNTADGIVVDGVLLNPDDVSILFSFTRSYFHVEVERPYDLSTGFNKHGKTELYRELLDHMTVCYVDRFDRSPGQPGMVMIVFNLPKDDLVFKLIRDRFDTPKKTTRRRIMDKYDLVFRHDRAGRLVDAQTFEHLKFNASCFAPQLLAELEQEAGRTVRIGKEYIIVDHAYVERRVTPLDVYLNEADEAQAQKIVIEWGNAIKDLAVSNIFPGDILLKNFGVTRHGRVVFYDYDELCLLTSCHFRKLPPADDYENEMAAEPWFYVGENDVFPEEFKNFLGLRAPLRDVFCEHHSDLFDVSFWQQAQQMIAAGELPHIYPYARSCRLNRK
jgi:isocitrate dehydrogenase kinase/phosphatase